MNCVKVEVAVLRERETETETERERQRENSKTLFYKDCILERETNFESVHANANHV